MKTLNQYRDNINSQCGEDGILSYLCTCLGLENGWCVEFGAWDGKHLSNTRHLIHDKGWHGVLIEGDPVRFRELKDEYRGRDRVHPLQAFVGFKSSDEHRLDSLLKQTPIPRNFDVLSIDVDGNDYYIWKALQDYTAKIVVIEANSSYDFWIDRVNAPDTGKGSSARALVRLASEKGYELVCHTGNCIFVQRALYPLVGLEDNSLEVLFDRKFVEGGFFRQLLKRLFG